MIVIGADTHKETHTCGAVFAATGELAGELTAPAQESRASASCSPGGAASTASAIWAIEDCRHVSGSLERFLVAAGERVVRVPPKLMGRSRRGERSAASPTRSTPSRSPGPRCARAPRPCPPPTSTRRRWRSSSCSITARISSGAALKTRAPALAPARPLARARAARPAASTASSGSTGSPAGSPAPSRAPGCGSPASWCAEIRRRTRRAAELEREIARPGRSPGPAAARSCRAAAPLTAAKLIAETAGAARFASDAKFARLAGVAPIPASSGNRTRHRLDRGGNRQLNCALHRIAVTQGRGPCPRPRLPRPKAGRGQVEPRSTALPQAPPGAPGLAAVERF